jgi:spore germination protein YaaH
VTTTAEPGSNAESYLIFMVNEYPQYWSNEYVKDNSDYTINFHYYVPIVPHQKVIIEVSGYEQDDTSANDPIPVAQTSIDPAQDWQIGGTYTIPSESHPDYSYTVQYSVYCAEQAMKVTRQFLGVYRAGSGGHALWNSNWNSFTPKWSILCR